jgi:hypothetical protein
MLGLTEVVELEGNVANSAAVTEEAAAFSFKQMAL